jgi:hypothetical protein
MFWDSVVRVAVAAAASALLFGDYHLKDRIFDFSSMQGLYLSVAHQGMATTTPTNATVCCNTCRRCCFFCRRAALSRCRRTGYSANKFWRDCYAALVIRMHISICRVTHKFAKCLECGRVKSCVTTFICHYLCRHYGQHPFVSQVQLWISISSDPQLHMPLTPLYVSVPLYKGCTHTSVVV